MRGDVISKTSLSFLACLMDIRVVLRANLDGSNDDENMVNWSARRISSGGEFNPYAVIARMRMWPGADDSDRPVGLCTPGEVD